jgi:hypothetical protein
MSEPVYCNRTATHGAPELMIAARDNPAVVVETVPGMLVGRGRPVSKLFFVREGFRFVGSYPKFLYALANSHVSSR